MKEIILLMFGYIVGSLVTFVLCKLTEKKQKPGKNRKGYSDVSLIYNPKDDSIKIYKPDDHSFRKCMPEEFYLVLGCDAAMSLQQLREHLGFPEIKK